MCIGVSGLRMAPTHPTFSACRRLARNSDDPERNPMNVEDIRALLQFPYYAMMRLKTGATEEILTLKRQEGDYIILALDESIVLEMAAVCRLHIGSSLPPPLLRYPLNLSLLLST